MTDRAAHDQVVPAQVAGAGDDVLFPTLTEAQLAELTPFGRQRVVEPGELLFRAGDRSYDFFVVLEGTVEIVRDGQRRRGPSSPPTCAGRFLGELSLLTGQRPYLTARVTQPGRVLVDRAGRLPPAHERQARPRRRHLRRLRRPARDCLRGTRRRPGHPDRRVPLLPRGHGAAGLRHPVRIFPTPGSISRTQTTPTCCWPSMGCGPPTPLCVITPTAVLRHPTPGEFAEHLGLTFQARTRVALRPRGGRAPARPGWPPPSTAPPRGSTPCRSTPSRIGGQAGASSRIENYVGFPNGISGGDLTARSRHPGPAARGPPQRPVRGRRACASSTASTS